MLPHVCTPPILRSGSMFASVLLTSWLDELETHRFSAPKSPSNFPGVSRSSGRRRAGRYAEGTQATVAMPLQVPEG